MRTLRKVLGVIGEIRRVGAVLDPVPEFLFAFRRRLHMPRRRLRHGLQGCAGRRLAGRRRNEIKIAGELVVDGRRLRVVDLCGHVLDLARDIAHHLVDGLAGLAHFRDQHAREHAVRVLVPRSEIVERLLAGAGGIDHGLPIGSGRSRLQTAGAQSAAVALERVVAAGIDDGQREFRLLVLHHVEDVLQLHRIILDLILIPTVRIHRDQEIVAVDLHAVAGIIKYHLIAAGYVALEIAHGLLHLVQGQIQLQGDLEIGRAQRLGHGLGIRAGIDQGVGMLITVIADHQRHPLGLCRCDRRQGDE